MAQYDMSTKGTHASAYEVPAGQVSPYESPYPQASSPYQASQMPASTYQASQPPVSSYGPQQDLPIHINSQGQTHDKGGNQRKGPLRLRGYRHIFDPYSVFKLGKPHFYRKPGYAYEKLAQHRHLDWFEREWVGDYDDRYISAWDGKVSKLVVQAVDDIYDGPANSTWRRTFIRNVSPFYMRLANWPFNHIDYHRNGGPTREDYPMLCVKWFFAALAITLVVGTPTSAEGKPRNNGKYDSVPYKYHGYPKVARNALEMPTPRGYGTEPNPISERLLRPRFLCFLREPGTPAYTMNVEEWIQQYKGEKNLQYVFVAYTAEQFRTPDDYRALHQMADAAARNAGAQAYWIGCSCMPEPENMQEDVYRICDVIRGAHSVAIAVARPPDDMNEIDTTDAMLKQWGSRIWTFPEVLLAPAGQRIKVYTRGTDYFSPIEVAKNQFAMKVWKDDAQVARQLIDHYEGNLILNQLELVTLALECLHHRDTIQYLPGDHSYALMGLLRIRPKIDPTDTAFQAFARLSLANNSDQLLERLICVMPKSPYQPWHSMDDAYNAKLWDILPQETSISGIGEDDTIILDGCRAANIRWKGFSQVAHVKMVSWKRAAAEWLIHLGGYTMIVAIVLLALGAPPPSSSYTDPFTGETFSSGSSASGSPLQVAGGILLAYSLVLMGMSPWLLRILYQGKFWKTQGWFFGFEGYMDIDTIEKQIWGGKLGRLKWSPYGSPLSRHHKNEYGDCIADDPCSDPAVAAIVEKARKAGQGEQRVFTIVDAGQMQVTMFLAERPPVCLILAGSEGGMQRAIGCSYDWTSQTMYRETVLRLETPIVDEVFRIPRVKVGFKRPQYPVRGFFEVGEANGHLSRKAV